ncbi:PqiC family protein [Chromobacterium sp. IIBBL 290-4]|uniref:PqiC family protein n=1 Tax=Chromobacterium sp. IIBBL 290-4 TaxID=2953890 RepID=UPI0020B6601D|nr:PqiC family protein [Chromobacterium sp. IIBBL 290-4]UTH73218.1 PqiC family protein [Chromobacterium sp. IIBBL 290-4]
MMKHWILAAAACAALAGCASPQSRFYGLDAPLQGAAPAQFGKRVLLGPVILPAALDRPQLVLDLGQGQLQLQEFDRWSAPLDRLLAQRLSLAVSRASGLASVYAYPQPGMDGGDLRIAVDVRALSLKPGQGAALEAVWQLQNVSDGKVLASGSFSRSQAAASSEPGALLASLQSLLDALAADLAAPLISHPEWRAA